MISGVISYGSKKLDSHHCLPTSSTGRSKRRRLLSSNICALKRSFSSNPTIISYRSLNSPPWAQVVHRIWWFAPYATNSIGALICQ
jgi:hypothetical protein